MKNRIRFTLLNFFFSIFNFRKLYLLEISKRLSLQKYVRLLFKAILLRQFVGYAVNLLSVPRFE